VLSALTPDERRSVLTDQSASPEEADALLRDRRAHLSPPKDEQLILQRRNSRFQNRPSKEPCR
jgi:hypothetical protein